ncbi:MAG: AmmeMemoRadiSam system protein B [Spirochaetaceae bacterium 4572_7]|nr:MAG: AmmeMemoRadiSam system protein B [Spirochaetaceae bacterium 4572_7]
MKKISHTKQPIVEGLFYPDDPDLLSKKIEQLMASNPTKKVKGNRIIVPHGGWDYTGDYIATGFNSLPKKDYKRVIIISNVHREFSKNIIIPESDKFLIAGNKINVDKEAISIIKKSGKYVKESNIPHMEEHGIETILPFVAHLYPKASIVPILLGKTIVSLVRVLTDIINSINNDDTLIIISSNFSSFQKESESLAIGKIGVELTKNGKLSELIEESRTNRLATCGAGAIASAILLGGFESIELLKDGLSKGSPLSGGKATYYATFAFES